MVLYCIINSTTKQQEILSIQEHYQAAENIKHSKSDKINEFNDYWKEHTRKSGSTEAEKFYGCDLI